jgi:hypothetical protein
MSTSHGGAGSSLAPCRRVEAKVCNRAGYHYGVEFLAIDTAQRQCVDQLRMHLASAATIS